MFKYKLNICGCECEYKFTFLVLLFINQYTKTFVRSFTFNLEFKLGHSFT